MCTLEYTRHGDQNEVPSNFNKILYIAKPFKQSTESFLVFSDFLVKE